MSRRFDTVADILIEDDVHGPNTESNREARIKEREQDRAGESAAVAEEEWSKLQYIEKCAANFDRKDE